MKFKILCLLLISCVSSSFAQLNGDGYYRVRNYFTERYIYIMDNKGSVKLTDTSVDLNAIVLSKEEGRMNYDPSCIVYIQSVGNNKYNLAAMGTSLYDFISYYVTIINGTGSGSDQTYFFRATESGYTLTLCDPSSSTSRIESKPNTNVSSGTRRNWEILPISSSDDTYFGIKPDVQIGDKYYKAYYVSFPFKLVSSGMKAFYASSLTGNGVAIKQEIASGAVIPAGTPVVIECSSSEPSSNRIEIVDQTATAIGTNILSGNYFYYNDSKYKKHINVTANDQSKMRLLGKMSNGEIGFVKSSLEYLPQNCAYLTVPSGSADEIPFLDESAGISSVTVDSPSSSTAVYTLQGVKVAESLSSTSSLAPGIYIVGGKKMVVK